MMASGSKHRRLLVNAVKHRELTAKMMLGLASISCQESVAKSALLFDTLRDLNKINYSGVLAADAKLVGSRGKALVGGLGSEAPQTVTNLHHFKNKRKLFLGDKWPFTDKK